MCYPVLNCRPPVLRSVHSIQDRGGAGRCLGFSCFADRHRKLPVMVEKQDERTDTRKQKVLREVRWADEGPSRPFVYISKYVPGKPGPKKPAPARQPFVGSASLARESGGEVERELDQSQWRSRLTPDADFEGSFRFVSRTLDRDFAFFALVEAPIDAWLTHFESTILPLGVGRHRHLVTTESATAADLLRCESLDVQITTVRVDRRADPRDACVREIERCVRRIGAAGSASRPTAG